MPLTHTRTFRVRYHECDSLEIVNNSHYLRYMAETAFDASAAAGYDMEKYEQIGKMWLIRESEVEFLKPLRYGDIFEIKTWVADFRRVQSLRMYEFRLKESEDLIARGQTNWIFLNAKTHRPATIPEEIKMAFFPEGPPKEAPRREPFPTQPPPPPGTVTFKRKVAWSDIDPTGHVNNARYLDFFQEAIMKVIDTFDLTDDHDGDIGWVIRKARIEYLQQARGGDTLHISTYLSGIKRASAIRHFAIRDEKTQEPVARAYLLFASIILSTGRPTRIPANTMAALAPNISEPDGK
jgi:acyl-CoA thioester hydrolase